MNRHSFIAGLVFGLSLILGTGLTMAGFQARKPIGRLTFDGWQLKVRDGQLGLARTDSGKWLASAPTITDAKGLFISGEGPFKEWYVAVDELPAEAKRDPAKAPDWQPLKLVSDPKRAAEFDYDEADYEVGHK